MSYWLVGDLECDGIFFDGNVVGVDDVQLGEEEQVVMCEWHFVSSESVRRYIYQLPLTCWVADPLEQPFGGGVSLRTSPCELNVGFGGSSQLRFIDPSLLQTE